MPEHYMKAYCTSCDAHLTRKPQHQHDATQQMRSERYPTLTIDHSRLYQLSKYLRNDVSPYPLVHTKQAPNFHTLLTSSNVNQLSNSFHQPGWPHQR